MEQIKSIAIVALILVSVILFYKPAPYEPPVWVEVPAEISDSLRQRIVSNANKGYVRGTEEELTKRFGKVRTKVKWRANRKAEDSLATVIDSLRIQGVRIQDSLRYVSILTDSTYFRLSKTDSALGIGFDLKIGLADTVALHPFDVFVHEFWLDSLVWKVEEKPVEKLGWIEWVVEYPDKVAIVALAAMIFGKL